MKVLLLIWLIFNAINGELICNNKVSLTASNSAQNGVSVQLLEDTAITVNNEWKIIPQHRNGALDMVINLDNNWGFDPLRVSTIRITMCGTTPIGIGDYDLITSFSVDSSKYVSSFFRLDNGADSSSGIARDGIYACDASPNPTQSLLEGDVYAISQVNTGQILLDKVRSRGDVWEPITAKNSQWPLIFTLTNDPINNHLFITYDGIKSQQCGFQAFPTNKGLQIYLAGDHAGEEHTFNRFDIEYCIGDTINNDECNNQYVYINDGVARTYAEAKALCDNNHVGLATIIDQDEFECATSLINGSPAWIGLQSLDDNSGSFTYLDSTQCPVPHNGIYGPCVPSSWWTYQGRPRCPYQHRDEDGSFCVNINNESIDNNIGCDKTLLSVLCNAAPQQPQQC